MAPNDLTQETNVFLKLYLADKGETRRIALGKLWNCGAGNVSFQYLVDLALQYSGYKEENVSEVCITYTDEDGDTISISSDEELSEAFEQFVHKVPPVVRATAKIKQGQQKQILQLKEQHPKSLERKQIEDRERAKVKNEEVEDRCNFLAAVAESSTTEPTTFKPRPAQQKAAITSTTKPTTVNVPKAEPILDKHISPAFFDPNFIHGHNTCDGCFTKPIIGYRFNATNRPNYNLCHNCFNNYKGDEIRFLPAQRDHDFGFQQHWRNKFQRREQAKSCGITPGNSPDHEAATIDQTDDKFSKSTQNEATRSLLNTTENEADTAPDEKEVAPKEEEVAPKEEEVAPKEETEKAQSKIANVPPLKETEDGIKDLIRGMFDGPIEEPATAASLIVARKFAELLKAQKAASTPSTVSSTNVSDSDSEKEDKMIDEGSTKKPVVKVVVGYASAEEEPDVKTPSEEVDNMSVTIELNDNSTLNLSPGEWSMVPMEGDTVWVTGGTDVGVEGELVCIDGSDAILKDSNEDFKIVDLAHLAKIVSDEA